MMCFTGLLFIRHLVRPACLRGISFFVDGFSYPCDVQLVYMQFIDSVEWTLTVDRPHCSNLSKWWTMMMTMMDFYVIVKKEPGVEPATGIQYNKISSLW